ncbi:MAG: cysteine hydrolase [Dehalococcoidales bacterium]|nr:cysteine hydrolase [Dehalococcoidales bacterium]
MGKYQENTIQQKTEIPKTIDPEKMALLLIHWQNSVAARGGIRSGVMPERLADAQTIEHSQEVLRASRGKKMLVIFINACFRPGSPEMPSIRLQSAVDNARAEAYLKGTWGAENIEELKPSDNDIVINNFSSSGFCYTELDLILRNKGITHLVLSGVATNWAVESTARDGSNRGYIVYTLGDCCNSLNQEMHDWTLKNILPALGAVLDSKTYITSLSNHIRKSNSH